MSIRFSVRRIPKEGSRSRRLMGYGSSAMSQARHGASNAVGWMGPAYGGTRDLTTHGIMATRGWTAPQLHRAARIFDDTLAPRVSSMLTGTAKWVEPPRRSHRLRNLMIGSIAMIACGCAAAGVMMSRRRKMNDMLEPEVAEYEERTGQGTYTSATGYGSGYSSSYGTSSQGTGFVGRGGGTGHSRGL